MQSQEIEMPVYPMHKPLVYTVEQVSICISIALQNNLFWSQSANFGKIPFAARKNECFAWSAEHLSHGRLIAPVISSQTEKERVPCCMPLLLYSCYVSAMCAQSVTVQVCC